MRALVAYGPQDYRIETSIPIPEPNEEEVLVKVLYSGVCASDLKQYKGSDFYWGKNGRVSLDNNRKNRIPGHEFVGQVVKIGQKVAKRTGLKINDIAVCEQLLTCHQCWYCQDIESQNKCDKLKIFGQALDGSFAEYMIYPANSFIHKVPDGLSPERAVLAEPLAVSIRAIDRANISNKDQTVIIAGCGTIGLGIISGLRYFYPQLKIIGLDKFQFKLDIAKVMGANEVFNINEIDCNDILENLKSKYFPERGGSDIYFECSGAAIAIENGLNLLRKKGKFIHVGICLQEKVLANWNIISAGKELEIIGSNLGRNCWDRAFQILLNGGLSNIITHVYSLEDFKDAFELAMIPEKAIKVLVSPDKSFQSYAKDSFNLYKHVPFLYHSTNTNLNNLNKPITFITGSSRGIGNGIAKEFAKNGHHIILHGTSLESCKIFNESDLNLNQLADKFAKEFNTTCSAIYGDLTNESIVMNICETIIKDFKSIDNLILAAGGNIGKTVDTETGGKPLKDDCINISYSDMQQVINRNLFTTTLVCKYMINSFIENNSNSKLLKKVIIIGSVAGAVGREQGSMYAVSKAAVHEYARCLATQLKPFNIIVNVVAPGVTLTERFKRNLGNNIDQNKINNFGLNRYGIVEDTAKVVVSLCGESFNYVSGQIIRVDGGIQTFAC